MTSSQNNNQDLILFDFDGTLTKTDSLFLFLKEAARPFGFYPVFGLCFPVLFYFMKFKKDPQRSKEFLLRVFLRGRNKQKIQAIAESVFEKNKRSIYRDGAEAAVRSYIAEGNTVAIVTASAYLWVQPFANDLGVDQLIATKMDIREKGFTGKFIGKNCNGKEKVRRVREVYNLSDFDKVIAYGDTAGDKKMLEMADESHFKPFREGVSGEQG